MNAARLSLLLLLFLAMPAFGQQNRPVDPVGTFDLTTAVQGQSVDLTLSIEGAAPAYQGTIATNITSTMRIRSVTVEGQQVTVIADSEDGEFWMQLTFTGNEVAGEWETNSFSGTVKGKRRAG